MRRADVSNIQPILRSTVPCDGCRLCCQNDLIVLHPEHDDKPEDYECERIVNPLTGRAVYALKRNEKNECIYLGLSGCTIHDRAPAICREFDCRKFFLKFSRQQRRMMEKTGWATKELFAAGRSRLASLKVAP